MIKDPYIRKCRILKVIDGDTLEVEIDLGFNMRMTERVRLLGINCPEMKGTTKAAGEAAHYFVEEWLLDNAGPTVGEDGGIFDYGIVFMRSEKDDSFGRWLALIETEEGLNLNQAILEAGHAVPWVKK